MAEESAAEKAQAAEQEQDEAKEEMEKLEEDPPEKLEDWPDDAAKYETFGGPEGEHGYHEGPEEEKLGPSSLRHKEDGGVTIAGEEVDDPDEYKSDPIPGGPTDPAVLYTAEEVLADLDGERFEVEVADRVPRLVPPADPVHTHEGDASRTACSRASASSRSTSRFASASISWRSLTIQRACLISSGIVARIWSRMS